jgi:hypothetical protein
LGSSGDEGVAEDGKRTGEGGRGDLVAGADQVWLDERWVFVMWVSLDDGNVQSVV